MNNPYCGWYKNSDTDSATGSNFDFLQFEENKEIDENTQELNSFKNSAYEKSNERK